MIIEIHRPDCHFGKLSETHSESAKRAPSRESDHHINIDEWIVLLGGRGCQDTELEIHYGSSAVRGRLYHENALNGACARRGEPQK